MQNWFSWSMGEDPTTKSTLRQTAEQFHILVDSVEEYAIYMLDPMGNIVTWNTGAEKIKQYTAEEIIGKNFACFYTAEEVAAENRNATYARPLVEVIFETRARAFARTDRFFRRKLS